MRLIIAVLAAGIFLLTVYFVFKKLWYRGLGVEVTFDKPVVYENEENIIREIITNRKNLPLPVLQVKFSITKTFEFSNEANSCVTDNYYRNEFFSVGPYSKITRFYPFTCRARGLYGLNDMDIICRSPFLENKMMAQAAHSATVLVLPGRLMHRNIPGSVSLLMGEVEKNLRIHDDPFTFGGLRDYQPYDSIKSINWKATARAGYPQVNIRNTTFSKRVVLLLNTAPNGNRHGMEVAEFSIKIAAHLAHYFISKGIAVALYTNGRDITDNKEPAIEEGSNLSHIRTIETALARLELKNGASSFAELMDKRILAPFAGTEYIIISSPRRQELTDRYRQLLKNGAGIHYIIPEYDRHSLETSFEKEFNSELYTRWLINL